jgi:hypothetical protein
VDLSGRRVAPALKTLFMEYGQSFAVKIGLAGYRVNRVSYFAMVAFMDNFAELFVGIINALLHFKRNRDAD